VVLLSSFGFDDNLYVRSVLFYFSFLQTSLLSSCWDYSTRDFYHRQQRNILTMSSSSSADTNAVASSSLATTENNNSNKKGEEEDPYLFLEEVESEESLTFATTANERCLSALGDPTLGPSYSRILNVFESKDRLAYATVYGYDKDDMQKKVVYNFWKDAQNPKGIWRKTTLEDYKQQTSSSSSSDNDDEPRQPNWKTVLDVDALAEQDGISWVWKGSNALSRRRDPMSQGGKLVTRSLLSLSRGGSDASFLKEFDMLTEDFVKEDPFDLPEAKTRASYKSRDVLLIGSAFADDLDGSVTDSGYPRTVREWERGTPISDAKTVFEGEKTDVAVNVRLLVVSRGAMGPGLE
jgi:prolyl oligopeptidase